MMYLYILVTLFDLDLWPRELY